MTIWPGIHQKLSSATKKACRGNRAARCPRKGQESEERCMRAAGAAPVLCVAAQVAAAIAPPPSGSHIQKPRLQRVPAATASVPSAPANPSHGGFASDQHSLEDRPFPLCPSIKMRGVCFACAMHELLLQALPLPTAPVGHHQPISPALFFVPAYAFPAPKKPPIETYARCALRNVQSQHTTAQTRMPGENRGGHLHACLPFGDKQVMYPFMLINCMSLPA